ncbi:partial Ribosome-associated ATPase, partial [Gammaproteobacteria bacterium]
MSAAISLSGVTKRFGKFTAVERLDLEIPVGVTFGLLGPNGAGKTTTIRMTMNITKADEGTVRILGQTLDEEGQQRIGYLPEERGLYRKM